MSAKRRVEVDLPNTRSADLRQWAENITEANPVSWDGVNAIEMWVTDQPFMGVELTFTTRHQAGVPRELFTLALFATVPTEREKEIMTDEMIEEQGS